ncbi:MAG: toxin HicA [Desulfobacteraceae bacterium]|nr:toxin HicA [Desulfobacteraceae bacterium]
MADIETILKKMKKTPKGIRFSDLCKVCDHYFGDARQKSSSHRIYKTSWKGNPRVNIQNDKGKSKAYQVKQVLAAVEKLK